MEFLKAFISLLVLINPIGAIPLFISLTQNQSAAQRKRTIRTASIAVALVIVISAFTGEWVIKLFGISMASFRTAGGILLLLLAISMLNAQLTPARQTQEESDEAGSKESVAVVPLAIPLLTGPGSISTVIIIADSIKHWWQYSYLVAAGLVIGAITYVALSLAGPISRMVGRTGINISTRIMGLLLAAVGIEFITSGLATLLPGLAR
ncbi:YchE family NAAT transporter [Chitinivorax sp. PXF-14]|uniref:YchE family NAAT transporter n=1 Tax=Chitinivorax sp. PXF-14 TaxID=3230488 RepID=UPI003466DFFB